MDSEEWHHHDGRLGDSRLYPPQRRIDSYLLIRIALKGLRSLLKRQQHNGTEKLENNHTKRVGRKFYHPHVNNQLISDKVIKSIQLIGKVSSQIKMLGKLYIHMQKNEVELM